MYRPTVRYDDRYKDYVQELFQATTLDRNQLIRLGLFLLGHTKEGENILNQYKKKSWKDPLPLPKWKTLDHGLWLYQRVETLEGGGTSHKDVNQVSSIEKGGTSHGDREERVIRWTLP